MGPAHPDRLLTIGLSDGTKPQEIPSGNQTKQ